jgi:gliding motility-associated-like protein
VLNTAVNFSLSVTVTQNSSCIDPNGSIDLVVSPPGVYAFQWSNGLTAEDIQNLVQGIYKVTVTDVSGCAVTASVIIEDSISVPEVTYLLSPAKCGEDNGAIDLTVVPAGANSFMWSNGDTSEDLHALSSGSYSVTVMNSEGCIWSSEFNVDATPALEINLGADLVADYGQVVTLRAEVNLPVSAMDTTIWLPQGLFSCHERICLEQVITPVEETLITFIVFDTSGCMAEQSIMLFLKNDFEVFIPNVFSPNADGSNDVFTVFANSDVTEVVDLRIFDRWGEFVFQNQHFPPNDPEFGWDGSYRDRFMEPQVFVYWTIIRLRDGTDHLYKGDVTLLR